MKQPLPPPIAVSTEGASACTGLNKKVLVQALASVGIVRFKVPGGQFLYLYSDLARGLELLKAKYQQEAGSTAALLNEKKF